MVVYTTDEMLEAYLTEEEDVDGFPPSATLAFWHKTVKSKISGYIGFDDKDISTTETHEDVQAAGLEILLLMYRRWINIKRKNFDALPINIFPPEVKEMLNMVAIKTPTGNEDRTVISC